MRNGKSESKSRFRKGLSKVVTAVGIDVGATFTRVAVVGARLNVLAERRFASTLLKDATAWMTQISEALTVVREMAGIGLPDVVPIGLAVPGTLNDDRTAVLRSVNLPSLQRVPIARLLEERAKPAPLLMTDAEACTWGEYACRIVPEDVARRTGGRTAERSDRFAETGFAHLRIGTGVACGVIVNGDLLRLDSGRYQHLEELVVNDAPDALPCRCGRRGCLEALVSGTALNSDAMALQVDEGVIALQRAWEHGDESVRDRIDKAARWVATAVRKIAGRWNANVICLGGGVVENLPALLDEVQRLTHEERAVAACVPSLESAQLGDSAGVIGAALLSARAHQERTLSAERRTTSSL